MSALIIAQSPRRLMGVFFGFGLALTLTMTSCSLKRLQEVALPTISMFYGIIIRMYFAPGEHPPPHFHVYHAEYSCTVDIGTCEMIEGNLPKKQIKLVLAWAELHQEELLSDWNLVMNGEEPFKIPPLQ